MRKRARASVLQPLPLNIPPHDEVEVGTMDKETGDFTPAQAAVHELHGAMPLTLSTPATAMIRPWQLGNHKGIA